SLMRPCVTGSPEGAVNRAIGISELKGIAHHDRTMISSLRFTAGKAAGLAIEFATFAARRPGPFAFRVGHEPQSIQTDSVIEAGNDKSSIPMPQFGGQVHLEIRIAARRPAQRDFKQPPPLDRAGYGLSFHLRSERRGRRTE